MAISANYFGTNGQLQPDIASLGRQFNTQTISSGAITYGYTLVKLAAESGTADDLTDITGADAGDMIALKADAGDTITLKNTGNLALDADIELTGDAIAMLIFDGTNWCSPLVSSGGGGSTDISCSVYKTSFQSVSALSPTAITFTAEDFDTDTMHDNSTNPERITFTTAGKYQFNFFVTFGTNTAGSQRNIQFELYDSSDVMQWDWWVEKSPADRNLNSNYQTIECAALLNVNAGDYIIAEFVHTGTSSMNVLGSATRRYTFMSAHKVG